MLSRREQPGPWCFGQLEAYAIALHPMLDGLESLAKALQLLLHPEDGAPAARFWCSLQAIYIWHSPPPPVMVMVPPRPPLWGGCGWV